MRNLARSFSRLSPTKRLAIVLMLALLLLTWLAVCLILASYWV